MTPTLLLEMCISFSPGNDPAFKAIVHGFLELPGTAQKDLARDCKVAISTVSRWARGKSLPGPHVQGFVVRQVRTRLQ